VRPLFDEECGGGDRRWRQEQQQGHAERVPSDARDVGDEQHRHAETAHGTAEPLVA
jgi:hypothetical protein